MICNLNFIRITFIPFETDSPLIVYAYAVLIFAVSF